MYGMSDAYGPSVDAVKNHIKVKLRKKIKEVQMVGGHADVITGLNLALQCLDEISESNFD